MSLRIVLVGYRAAGKSTLGRLLARQLDWPCLDVDRDIETACGKSLAAFYQEDGDQVFRDLESDVVRRLCSRPQCIVSMGAGSLMRPQNQEIACRDALVVYLRVPDAELWRRISADPRSAQDRPNLRGGGIDEVHQMLALREPVYRRCADLEIDATRPPEELAEDIIITFRRLAPPQGHCP
jgi:shikimate kinase